MKHLSNEELVKLIEEAQAELANRTSGQPNSLGEGEDEDNFDEGGERPQKPPPNP